MQCHRLIVANFCKHRHRIVDFTAGLIALIGPNGSGKSNILEAIRYALTGENHNAGPKAANICDRAPVTENSYVELYFSHGAVNAVVRRNFRPARPTAVLTINGTETIEGDIEVTSRIEQLLGITTDILNNIVIVGQDEILGFIDKSPAKRAEQFQRLFRTEQAGVLHKLIGDQLKTVEVPTVGVDRDALRTQITETQQRVLLAETQIAQLPSFEDMQKHRDANATVVRQFDDMLRLTSQATGVMQQQQAARASHLGAQENTERARADRQLILDARNGIASAVESARTKLANLAAVKQQMSVRQRASERVDAVQRQIAHLTTQAPVMPQNYLSDLPSAEARYQSVYSSVQQHERLTSSFKDGMVACPTCYTPVDKLIDRLAGARTALPGLRLELTTIETNIKASREYNRQQGIYTTAQTGLQQQLTAATAQLQDLQVASLEVVDEVSLNQILLNDKTYVEGLSEYDQLINSNAVIVGRCEGQLSALQTQYEQLQQQISALPFYTAEQRDQAQQQVIQWDMAAATRRQHELQRATEQAHLDKMQEQLAAANTLAATAAMLRGWHACMEGVRGVFHKDAAPRFVAQRNLQMLQHTMNESLEMFATDFRVNADEGLSFEALFEDGSRQPADRLSGGQQVILALAFRLSLNLMFAENIGALYLDEPTAWLDEHHIRGFEPVLGRLREFSAARGLQSIIITHERELAPLFDSVISL